MPELHSRHILFRLRFFLPLFLALCIFGCSRVFFYAPADFEPRSANLKGNGTKVKKFSGRFSSTRQGREIRVSRPDVNVTALRAYGRDNFYVAPGCIVENLGPTAITLDITRLAFQVPELRPYHKPAGEALEPGEGKGALQAVYRADGARRSASFEDCKRVYTSESDAPQVASLEIAPGSTATFRFVFTVDCGLWSDEYGDHGPVWLVLWKKGMLDISLTSEGEKATYDYRFSYKLE